MTCYATPFMQRKKELCLEARSRSLSSPNTGILTHIQATWASIMSNLDNNNVMAPIAGPGHWNDPDMLQVGNPGLSDTEARAHFSAWCIVAAPLLIGADIVSGLDNATLAILGAPELVAVDQDPLGVQVCWELHRWCCYLNDI